MEANLAENVKNALQGKPVRSVHGWLDSTVALHWIRGEGSAYKQFVANRVNKIRDKTYIQWRHVGTYQNPTDIGSRGCQLNKLSELWFQGPEWLTEVDIRPGDILTEPNKEAKAEARLTKEIFATVTETKDSLDGVLKKKEEQLLENGANHNMDKTVLEQLQAEEVCENRWPSDDNRDREGSPVVGSTSVRKLELNRKVWRRQANPQLAKEQRRAVRVPRPNTRKLPNLFATEYCVHVVWEVGSRRAHADVTWRSWSGVDQTWLLDTRLRQLTKKVINGCFGCKKFQAKAFGSPPPGNLPIDRIMDSIPFQKLAQYYTNTSRREMVKLISCYLPVVWAEPSIWSC